MRVLQLYKIWKKKVVFFTVGLGGIFVPLLLLFLSTKDQGAALSCTPLQWFYCVSQA